MKRPPACVGVVIGSDSALIAQSQAFIQQRSPHGY